MSWQLKDLREANETRQAEWCPEKQPDISFRGNELAGEVGEACNCIKKLERERLGWAGSRSSVQALAEELADVVICADLSALAAGIDLQTAVREKFNATSEKIGLSVRLGGAPWTRNLPNESGFWWWWNEDEDSLPYPIDIQYSGTSDSYFASIGQFGWTRAQEVSEMGGWWMRLPEPERPTP